MTEFSDHEIEDAIRTVASLIDRFGDAYWPILERLEDELEHRRARQTKLRNYLRPLSRDKINRAANWKTDFEGMDEQFSEAHRGDS